MLQQVALTGKIIDIKNTSASSFRADNKNINENEDKGIKTFTVEHKKSVTVFEPKLDMNPVQTRIGRQQPHRKTKKSCLSTPVFLVLPVLG